MKTGTLSSEIEHELDCHSEEDGDCRCLLGHWLTCRIVDMSNPQGQGYFPSEEELLSLEEPF
jgi:hypothetical protein